MLKTKKPKVLVVDDTKEIRNSIKDFFQTRLKWDVKTPKDFQELKKLLITETFDGFSIDKNLKDNWELEALNGHYIKDGMEVEEFCKKLHPHTPSVMYSTKTEAGRENSLAKLKGTTDLEELLKGFEDFSSPVNRTYKFIENKQPGLSKILKYKFNLELYKDWLNFSFEKLGNYLWATVKEKKIENIGRSVNEHQSKIFNKITIVDSYPNRAYFEEPENYFIFWNSHSFDLLSQQFKQAGDNLEKIPNYLQEYFSLCMAPTCVRYFEEYPSEILKMVKNLPTEGQLDFVKTIFIRTKDEEKRNSFIERCQDLLLPVIVSVFRCRVDEFETVDDEEIAHVHVKKIHYPRAKFFEQFSIDVLKANGIQYINEFFEYTVWKSSSHSTSYHILPEIVFEDF